MVGDIFWTLQHILVVTTSYNGYNRYNCILIRLSSARTYIEDQQKSTLRKREKMQVSPAFEQPASNHLTKSAGLLEMMI